MPGQAAASEVHQTIRLSASELAQASPGSTWSPTATEQVNAPAPDNPFPETGQTATFGVPYDSHKTSPPVMITVLGVVAGLVLGLLGVVAVLLGTAIESDSTRVAMFVVGLALLGAAVVLSTWTPTVTITAGVLMALPGLFGVFASEPWANAVAKLPHIDLNLFGVPADAAVYGLGSYVPAVAGVLLVTAGVTTALLKRRLAA